MRRFTPKKEVDHKTELEVVRKMLKKFHDGLYRVNGLWVAHAQNLDTYEVSKRHSRRINRWGRVSPSGTYVIYRN